VEPFSKTHERSAKSPASNTAIKMPIRGTTTKPTMGLPPPTVPVHVVAARLGHADPSITLRVYAHVISDQLTEAADIFARAVAVTN
jgi:hypothetical protein